METIKVNMNPNPLDVQTIHASQNDGEARQWEFELHNNGELIDTSGVADQMVFKAYKGGTEQILPENGSTPTTAPIIADIRYPDALRTDQTFLYRESPTPVDGLAKIKSIKGNTLKWNQQTHEINSTYFTQNTGNIVYSDNSCTITATETSANIGIYQLPNYRTSIANHKYLISANVKRSSAGQVKVSFAGTTTTVGTSETVVSNIETCPADRMPVVVYGVNMQSGETITIKNLMLFDLTQMFGSGNEPTSVSDFTSLFPLPYYAYNQGTLLSFMGNGIKTVGKNLIEGISQGAVGTHGETDTNANRLRVDGFVRVLQGEQYTFSASKSASTNLQIYTRFFADNDGSEQVSYLDWLTLPRTINIPNGINYATFTIRYQTSTAITPSDIYDVQLEIGASATDYEPYTSSTLSLPISTYFPNGMKSAGSVYDELTETKAITRIGSVDLGSLTWEYRTTGSVYAPYFYASFTGIKPNGNPNVRKANILCSKYSTANRSQEVFIDKTICADGSSTELTQIQIKDSSYTDATTFKSAMSGVYLYYELATPTETSFTTASLVTENAEIPLSNEDGVLVGKCTEQLSENPGFIDAKIKLADEDGECYSNMIQLHIERSPQ